MVLGRIGAPFGVQGWLKVQSYTDPPEGIAGYPVWELHRGSSLGRKAVLEWKRAGSGVAVRLEGVDSREAAQALTGAEVRVERAELPPTAPGEYYWHDLIGLDAFSLAGRAARPGGRDPRYAGPSGAGARGGSRAARSAGAGAARREWTSRPGG